MATKAASKEDTKAIQATGPNGGAIEAPLDVEAFLASNALAVEAETQSYLSGADDLAQSAIGIAYFVPKNVIHGVPCGRHPGGPKAEASRIEKQKKMGPLKADPIEGLWLMRLESPTLVEQQVMNDMGDPVLESDGEGGQRKKTKLVQGMKGDIILINASHAIKPYLEAGSAEQVAVMFTVKGKVSTAKGNKMWDFAIASAKPLATLNAIRSALPPATEELAF